MCTWCSTDRVQGGWWVGWRFGSVQQSTASLEEVSLRSIVRACECLVVGGDGLVVGAELSEEVGAGGVERLVVGELLAQRVDRCQSSRWAV
jgi:hypothetical protein